MQQRLDEAVDNYLRISNLLRDDLIALLDVEDETPAWRRNFVRVGAALIEGHTHCLREISLVAMACEPTKISRKESQALQDERPS
jgi:hypothetical protein